MNTRKNFPTRKSGIWKGGCHLRTGIYLREIINAFSLMLDIAEKSSFHHSRRTTLIACLLGKEMGLLHDIHSNLFYSAILHDIGFAGSLDFYTVKGFHMDPILIRQHTNFGAELAKMLPFDHKISEIIKLHHERWDGMGPYQRSGADIPIEAQIITLADHLETHYDPKNNSRDYRKLITNWVANNRGKAFSPAVVDVFLSLAKRDRFWIEISIDDPTLLLRDYYPRLRKLITLDDLENIAACFARVVDSKSPFTHEHSRCVAVLTKHCAEGFGFDALTVRKLYIAGYLHDLGKLAVPTSLLEKQGPLTEEEWEVVKTHPYFTGLILKQINGFEDIARWASNHHERLNGKGYVQGLADQDLTYHDQIIAAADVYHALREKRSYRAALPHVVAVSYLQELAESGALSPTVVTKFVQTIEDNNLADSYCHFDASTTPTRKTGTFENL